MQKIIAPSLLAADFANLQRDIEMINNSEADWFHVDVMDGVFVPNISFGMPVLEAINKHAKKPLDVHVMIVQPEKFIAEFKKRLVIHMPIFRNDIYIPVIYFFQQFQISGVC